MNREAALLGTPTYTLFAGRLAAVDAELIRLGLMHDLRDPAARPSVVKKGTRDSAALRERGDAALRARGRWTARHRPLGVRFSGT